MADYRFDIEDELILIPVRLFGKQATSHNCEFILDTGSSGSHGQGVEGLVGMTFLKRFNWCVLPEKQIIRTDS